MKVYQSVVSACFAAALSAALLSGCSSVSYQQGRPEIYTLQDVQRVAVLPFAYSEFTDLVIDALVNSSEWDVYDRRSLVKVMAEQDLLDTGRFDKEQVVELGRLVGVQVVIFGGYDYPNIRMEAVSVETGKYLAHRTFDVGAWGPKDFRGQAAFALQALLPYWIEYKGGVPVDARYGPLADCLTHPELMENLQEALVAIRAKDDVEAVDILSELLTEEENNPQLLNLLAWVLATSPDAEIRDGDRAVELAMQALSSGADSVSEFTDTLAAAHAEAGAFDKAVEAQAKALVLLGDGAESQRQALQRRLALYRAGKPMRR